MHPPLQVPATEKIRHILLDTDRRRLASEIRDLPYADMASALLMAHRRLHAFNRFQLPPATRLDLLTPFHYAFTRAAEHYRRQFDSSLFSREPNHTELDLLLDFLRELGFACKHLIRDLLASGKRTQGLAPVIHRTLLYLHSFALFSCNRGRLLRPAFWQEVHFLYFTALERQQHEQMLEAGEGRTTSIEQMYKQLVLFGLASPFSLTGEEQWRTQDYLARFAGLAALVPVTHPEPLLDSYFLDEQCRQPARLPGEAPATDMAHLRLLDLSAFVDGLQRHLTGVKTGDSLRTLGMERVQRRLVLDLLTRLYGHWTRNPVRRGERRPIRESIGLVWGLDTICTMLDPQQRLRAQPSPQNNRAWAQGDNESDSGIRLRMTDTEEQYPDAGQLVALIRQHNQQKTLQLGLVQWSALDQDDLPFCGVQRLPGTARKVSILNQDDQTGERNGLLVTGRTSDGRSLSLLVAPNGSLKPGSRAQVYSPQQIAPLQIETFAVTHRTRQVETFEIRLLS